MSDRKDAFYFPHDSNARDDQKIIQLRLKMGWEGYGIYWAFLEICREANTGKNPYSMESETAPELLAMLLGLHETVAQEFVNNCTEIGLLSDANGRLFSRSFVKRMERIDAKRLTAKKNGRKGGRPKAKPNNNPEVNPTLNPLGYVLPNQNETLRKERKGKETTPLPPKGEDGDGGGIFAEWFTAWKKDLAGLDITTAEELQQACDRNHITAASLVAALLEVTAREKAGSPSSNRKARVRSVIKDGIGSTYMKQAMEAVSRNKPEPVRLPTREEVEAGKAETLKAAQEVKALFEARNQGSQATSGESDPGLEKLGVQDGEGNKH